jgi:hypothetical protein
MLTDPARVLVAFALVTSLATGCRSEDSSDAGAVGGATSSSGGSTSSGGAGAATGGSSARATTGGRGTATGGSGAATGGSSGSSTSSDVCNNPSLVWKSANKTNYTSYPDPGSEECVKYNGCTWAGQFAACDGKKSEDWVASHNIVSAFPDFTALKLHDLCLRKGTKSIVVTVLDTCADSDCSGCCTENKGSADQLIDIESYTDARWGVSDGPIEWADLGVTTGSGCN